MRETILSLGKNDGFSYFDMLKELIDNSQDANATQCEIDLSSKNTIIIRDNGHGLTEEGWQHICELKSKKTDCKDCDNGRFGIGAKKAMAGLSGVCEVPDDAQVVKIISRGTSEPYVNQAILDYQKLIKTKDSYINGIKPEQLEMHSIVGTFTEIIIHTNSGIYEELKSNLYVDTLDPEINLLLNLSITYHDDPNFTIKYRTSDGDFQTVPKFDFNLGQPSIERRTYLVKIQSEANKKLYHYDVSCNEVHKGRLNPSRSGHKDRLEKVSKNTNDKKLTTVGEFTVNLSFNRDRPNSETKRVNENLTDGEFEYLCQYKSDQKIKPSHTTFLKNIVITRNRKVLSLLDYEPPPGVISSGTTFGKHALLSIRKQLQFESSTSDNFKMDNILGLTQENKSSVQWKIAAKGLKKLLGLVVDLFNEELENAEIVAKFSKTAKKNTGEETESTTETHIDSPKYDTSLSTSAKGVSVTQKKMRDKVDLTSQQKISIASKPKQKHSLTRVGVQTGNVLKTNAVKEPHNHESSSDDMTDSTSENGTDSDLPGLDSFQLLSGSDIIHQLAECRTALNKIEQKIELCRDLEFKNYGNKLNDLKDLIDNLTCDLDKDILLY